MTEPTDTAVGTTATTSVPATPPTPPAPPAAKESEPTKAFASNAEPTVTEQEKADIAARDAAVEAKAAAYEEQGETAAADAIRAQYEDKPADASA